MKLGQKIYNDLVNHNMSERNGYCGIFDLYPEITAKFLIEYMNTNTELGVDKHPICKLHKNNVANFFENISFIHMLQWLFNKMSDVSDEITQYKVERKAKFALDIICHPIYEKNIKENWYEYYDNSVFENINKELGQEISKSILAVVIVSGLLISDFKLMLQNVLVSKYKLNINI